MNRNLVFEIKDKIIAEEMAKNKKCHKLQLTVLDKEVLMYFQPPRQLIKPISVAIQGVPVYCNDMIRVGQNVLRGLMDI